ncbi:hypothetical protein BDZ91DRAFT_740713 [Kalaharituber pfeilii]|nr:hypothetical protein BDZ91DRAFT_744224 [Kalaharituber pfeilii]KAF8459960.1 hypothetical protein BDZ91DRAFT_740713 [Kalaharituber pfeilii]
MSATITDDNSNGAEYIILASLRVDPIQNPVICMVKGLLSIQQSAAFYPA